MARSEDFVSGLQGTRYQNPFVTGLQGAVTGFEMGRALKTARQESSRKKDFEKQVGVNYDTFIKLKGDVQKEILRAAGVISDPEGQPLSDFGGRSLTELKTQGAPSRTQTAGGTGIFQGIPEADVQSGPPLPPLGNAIGSSQMGAMNRYLGIQPETTPAQENLMSYRDRSLQIRGEEAKSRIALMGLRGKQAAASTRALDALASKRSKPDEMVPTWMVRVGRNLGLAIPEDATPTQKQFDSMLKFNRPAQAVIARVTDLVEAARDAEIRAGKDMTPEQLARFVKMQTTRLIPMAGSSAPGMVLTAVKEELAALREAAKADLKPNEDEEIQDDQIPQELQDEEENPDYDPALDDTGGDDGETGYGR